MIQVRRVAAQLRAAAERELAERPEALNSRLLVLHLLPPPEQGTWVYTKWCQDGLLAVDVRIAIPVPRNAVLEGVQSA